MNFKKCLLIALFFPGAAFAQQESSPYPVQDLHVKWTLKDNHYGGQKNSLSSFTLVNRSAKRLPAGNWSLYFNSIEELDLPAAGNATIEQINGDLFRLRPGKDFKGLNKGDSVVFDLVTKSVVKNFTDAPGGLYLVWDNQPDQGIKINHYDVRPPHESFKDVVSPLDYYNRNNKFVSYQKKTLIKILPTPVFYEEHPGNFALNQTSLIATDPAFKNEADYFAAELQELFKVKTTISSGLLKGKGIQLVKTDLKDDGYQLEVSPQSVIISAGSAQGAFYALQSLKSLLLAGKQENNAVIPCVSVKDGPRFKYRSLMVDVARNFHSKKEVFRILDLMALYKLNVFHFHLTDDEGWRLAIPGLPELTEIGAKRGHTLTTERSLPPMYNSGPDTSEVLNRGFYTTADFIEILKYARQRHIEIVPEIETPGHARAAIKAMDARYRNYMVKGMKDEAEEYLLSDLKDSSVYRSAQYWNDNVICVAQPSVYRFLETITNSLQAMYQSAGIPLKTIHFGGDEVPQGVWEKSPLCLALMKQEKMKSTADLWSYYIGKLHQMLKPKGIVLSGWEEMGMRETSLDGEHKMVPNPLFVNDAFQLDVWNNIVGRGMEDLPYRLANMGYKVVLTCSSNFYLDMAYDRSLAEPGHSWAGYVPTEKLFSFIPYNYYKNSTEDSKGEPVTQDVFIGKDRLTDFGKSNILGIKGALWTEKVITPERLEYMLLPRLLGLAERAWAQDPAWAVEKDKTKAAALYEDSYADFYTRIGEIEFPKLDKIGARYRVPPVGVKVTDNKVSCNTEFPGFSIYYTTDGKEPSVKDKRYTQPFNQKGLLKFKAFNATGRGGNTTTVLN